MQPQTVMPPQPAPGFGQGGLVPQSHTLMQSNETASAVLAAQARAVIEARYLIAINRPRDLDVVREKLLKECRRPGFAEVATLTRAAMLSEKDPQAYVIVRKPE